LLFLVNKAVGPALLERSLNLRQYTYPVGVAAEPMPLKNETTAAQATAQSLSACFRKSSGRESSMAKRTVLRSKADKKLYAVRSNEGKFKDIQSYQKAHSMDLKRSSKSEVAAKAKAEAKKAAAAAANPAPVTPTALAPVAPANAARKAPPKTAAPKVAAPKTAAKPVAVKVPATKPVDPKVAPVKAAPPKAAAAKTAPVKTTAPKKAAPKPAAKQPAPAKKKSR
jgi:hypothetical protein